MLIKLDPGIDGFDRVWVTGGFDDFLHAGRQWIAAHADCGPDQSVEDRVGPNDDLRRVWFYCACGRKRLLLGPPSGGDMTPIFPRMQ